MLCCQCYSVWSHIWHSNWILNWRNMFKQCRCTSYVTDLAIVAEKWDCGTLWCLNNAFIFFTFNFLVTQWFTHFFLIVKVKTTEIYLTQTSMHYHRQLQGTEQFQQSKTHQHSWSPWAGQEAAEIFPLCYLTPAWLAVLISGTSQSKFSNQLYPFLKITDTTDARNAQVV